MTARRVRPVGAEFYVSSPFGPRWGSQHRGVDYGRNGGSAGAPVFAAAGGTVQYCGRASGFGGPDPAGWIVIDHPTADGGGATVYGHIIRDPWIRVGARVEAGQRIATINPDTRTNGSVPGQSPIPPHLHFETCPRGYGAGLQIDPVGWLHALGTPPAPDAPDAIAGPPPVMTLRPTVQLGARGTDVRDLQARLNRDYPAYSRLVVDGDFGPATDRVVREFQRRSNLQADGVVGALTWKALGL